jgi:hypothetical protein
MSDDNAYNKNVNRRMQEELAEFNTPQARYQQQLDRHWQAQREFEEEADDFYMVGGFQEQWSKTPSFTKSRRDRDWRVR